MQKNFKSNSISLLKSKNSICAEWDHSKNYPETPDNVTQFSQRKVWWTCSEGHSYQARIANRTKNGTGCPVCSGRIVGQEASFPHLFPEIFSEWNHERNSSIDPYKLSRGSSKKVWWRCANGHEWCSSIGDRTSKGTRCDRCRGRVPTQEKNALTDFPEITDYWDYSKNEKQPFELPSKSPYMAHWKCGNGHTWVSRISEFLKRKKSKCLICTSIGYASPLMAEWDWDENKGIDPHTLQASSVYKAHWVCTRGHKWISRIADRTRGASCTKCRSNQTSAAEIRIFSEFLWLFNDNEAQQTRVKWRSKINNREVDILIPQLRVCIEHDGAFFHRNKNDSEKNEVFEKAGYTVIRVRELPLPKIRSYDILYKAGSLSPVDVLQIFLVIYKLPETAPEIKALIDRYREAKTFRNEDLFLRLTQMLPSPLLSESLAALHPQLAAEWDFERNSFGPAEVRPYSTLEVSWKCEFGHIWRQTVRDRVDHGKRCKACNSLAFSSPKIAQEWSERNFPAKPEDISRASGKIFWWKCINGHEWQAAVNARTKLNRSTGCPRCSKARNQYS